MQLNKPGMILIPLFPDYEQNVDQDLRVFIAGLVAKDYYFDRCMYDYGVYRVKNEPRGKNDLGE
jgi:hypothetical protein